MTGSVKSGSHAPEPTPQDAAGSGGLRIDKWLWTARFFKTRSAAAQAVSGGHVHVEGERVKPARKVKPGETLRVRRGAVEWEIMVKGVAERRGPAPEARTLYEETEDSVRRREHEAEQRKLTALNGYRSVGKPNKRERRDLERLRGKRG